MVCFTISKHELFSAPLMDCTNYYKDLECWLKEQYKHINDVNKKLEECLVQQRKYVMASYMAAKKYDSEMKLYQNNSNNNANSQTNVPRPTRPSFNVLFGASEYRTLRRAHGWVKSELNKRDFPMSKLETLLFIAHIGSTDDILDFDVLLLADQLGRFLCAVFEAVLISHSLFSNSPGGATFGKWLMNLKVVTCEEIVAAPDSVEVIPGNDLGFFRALIRSLLKNASFLTFFSFICMLLFQYHRCTYDIIAGTLVVQSVPAEQGSNTDQEQQEQQEPVQVA